MNRRERLLAIFQGRVPDRPAIKLWGAGPGQQLMHPAYQPVLEAGLEKTDILYESPRYLNWQELYWGAEPPPITVERAPTANEAWDEVTTTLHTPAGPLRSIRRVHKYGQSGYDVEHFIKEPADMERLFSFPYVKPKFDPEPFHALDREIGDRGLPIFLLSNAPAAVTLILGSEQFGYWLYDYKEELTLLLHTFFQRMVDHVQEVIASGIRGVFGWGGPEVMIPPLVSMACFEEFYAPFDRELVAMIHNAGSYVWLHSHGKVKNLLARFAEIGYDVINPIEPPPMGDVTLAEAFDIVGDRCGLEGNIQAHEIFTASTERVRELVREALDAGMGKRFILSPASYYTEDAFPTERYINNWLIFIDEGVSYSSRGL